MVKQLYPNKKQTKKATVWKKKNRIQSHQRNGIIIFYVASEKLHYTLRERGSVKGQ